MNYFVKEFLGLSNELCACGNFCVVKDEKEYPKVYEQCGFKFALDMCVNYNPQPLRLLASLQSVYISSHLSCARN